MTAIFFEHVCSKTFNKFDCNYDTFRKIAVYIHVSCGLQKLVRCRSFLGPVAGLF